MSSDRGESWLRVWLAGRLNREDVPDYVWELLDRRLHLSGATGGAISRERLAGHARTLLSYGDIAESASIAPEWYEEKGKSPAAPELDTYEEKRAQVLAQYIALRTAMHPEVTLIRDLVSLLDSPSIIEELQESPRQWREIIDGGEREDESLGERAVSRQPSPIARVAEEISRELNYYWREDEVIKFLWADEVEWREPVEAELNAPVDKPTGYGTINLKIDPWVPAETVIKFYQYHQIRMLGRRQRVLSMRNLEAALFILEQLRGAWYKQLWCMKTALQETKSELFWYDKIIARRYPLMEGIDLSGGPSWQLLLNLWNRKHDEQYDNERRFRQDFYRATRAVVYPYKSVQRVGFGEARTDAEE